MQAHRVTTLGNGREPPIAWPEPDSGQMTRDFMLWRHLRVVRARLMRHLHRAASILSFGLAKRAGRTVYGVPMCTDWEDRSYAYCHYGTYGDYLADVIASIKCPFVFLDIGANQGLFSLLAAQQPACKLALALEPVAATFDQLEANIALNRCEDRVIPLEFGLSDQAGVRMVTRHRSHSGLATLESHICKANRNSISQPVNIRRVAGLLDHLPDGLPLFVKIDVAGHEATVIEEVLSSPCADRIIGIFYAHDESLCDTSRIERTLAQRNFRAIRKFGFGTKHDALAVPDGPPGTPGLGSSPARCPIGSQKSSLRRV